MKSAGSFHFHARGVTQMADALYTIAKTQLLNGGLDLDTDVIKARLVTSSYTFSGDHAIMSDIGVGVGTDPTLAVTISNGRFMAADSTWTAVAQGSTIVGVVIYKFVTNDAASIPICYIDSIENTVTNGGAIVIDWDDTNGIFYL